MSLAVAFRPGIDFSPTVSALLRLLRKKPCLGEVRLVLWKASFKDLSDPSRCFADGVSCCQSLLGRLPLKSDEGLVYCNRKIGSSFVSAKVKSLLVLD